MKSSKTLQDIDNGMNDCYAQERSSAVQNTNQTLKLHHGEGPASGGKSFNPTLSVDYKGKGSLLEQGVDHDSNAPCSNSPSSTPKKRSPRKSTALTSPHFDKAREQKRTEIMWNEVIEKLNTIEIKELLQNSNKLGKKTSLADAVREHNERVGLAPNSTGPLQNYIPTIRLESLDDIQLKGPLTAEMLQRAAEKMLPAGEKEEREQRIFEKMRARTRKTAPESSVPFPSIDNPTFGLIQEELAHDPFWLLIATIFLTKTKGTAAVPVLKLSRTLSPTPQHVMHECLRGSMLSAYVQPLGLHKARMWRMYSLALSYTEHPPAKGRRFRKVDYPFAKAHASIAKDEVLDDADPRPAFEIAHLAGIGPYGIDSWRIFCRDVLRGLASDHNGGGRVSDDGEAFEPEWKRVQPEDKELRAYLRWMWLREGVFWDPETGEKLMASEGLMERARKGTVLNWKEEKERLLDQM